MRTFSLWLGSTFDSKAEAGGYGAKGDAKRDEAGSQQRHAEGWQGACSVKQGHALFAPTQRGRELFRRPGVWQNGRQCRRSLAAVCAGAWGIFAGAVEL